MLIPISYVFVLMLDFFMEISGSENGSAAELRVFSRRKRVKRTEEVQKLQLEAKPIAQKVRI